MRFARLGSVLSLTSLSVAAIAALHGCGAGGAGNAVRPKETTAAEGISEGPCREVESGGEPLVVDWKPEQRGDLEVAMKENVAIVSYSCKGFKLLKDCHVDGKYGFLGMSKKEQVVKLSNADEVKANLPLSGIGIAGNVSGEMQRGSTLDIAMVMIGKIKTTWAKVQVEDLKGEECAGATHFVRGAMIGAFAMQTGTKGQVKSAAQMFGAGASGNSTSGKNIDNKDGDITDCVKATPDDKKAPEHCAAFIRLELKAIAPKATGPSTATPAEPKPASGDIAEAESTCPKGLVRVAGKCAEPKTDVAFACNPSKVSECEQQCGKGNAQSCGSAGALFVAGGGGARRDEAKARTLLGKGCDAADTRSCVNLGVLLTQGRGGAKDSALAAKNFERGCADADASACTMLGNLYKTGEGVAKDDARAVALLAKGCEGGNDEACGTYGKMLLDGTGTSKDAPKGLDALKRACDGSQAQACVQVGLVREEGKDATKDPIAAKMLYQRGCVRGSAPACFNAGRMELGFGGTKEAAKRAFEQGCNRNDKLACGALKVLFGANKQVMTGPEVMEAGTRCTSGSMRDCGVAGMMNVATGNAMGKAQLDRGCVAQDPLACAVKAATK